MCSSGQWKSRKNSCLPSRKGSQDEAKEEPQWLLKEPHKGKEGFLCYHSAVETDWTFAEHIWKRKRRDNRHNECAGDNSSSSGKIISSLWFNMMIDHLCPPALFWNSDEGQRDPCLSELKLQSPEIENIFISHSFFFHCKNSHMSPTPWLFP